MNGVVGLERADGRLNGREHRHIDGVQPLRPVKGDDAHMIPDLSQDDRFAHGLLPCRFA
jgi:hypothetical protein